MGSSDQGDGGWGGVGGGITLRFRNLGREIPAVPPSMPLAAASVTLLPPSTLADAAIVVGPDVAVAAADNPCVRAQDDGGKFTGLPSFV
jgi:hypothetical protein